MITWFTKVKLVAFLIIGSLTLYLIGTGYADLGRYVGLESDYTIKVDLAKAGGLAPNAEVTYRGVAVGRVGELDVTRDGVIAHLRIRKDAPKIPADASATVANRSAIGEQYIDLKPTGPGGPYLVAGSVIPRNRTATPAPVTDMLTSINNLASSVPLASVRTVVDELGVAFNGQGPNLKSLLDSAHAFTKDANKSAPETKQLIVDSAKVLQTQKEEADALKSFGSDARKLAEQLRSSDTDLRRLLVAAPQAATQFTTLMRQMDPHLSVLLANLMTTSDILYTRNAGLEELLVRVPAAVSVGTDVVRSGRLSFAMVTTFFNPPPCTRGYGGTKYRNGLDTKPGKPLNTAARCTMGPGSGVLVRGSANAPSGSVPKATRPGSVGAATTAGSTLPGALGLPALSGTKAPGMAGLLGLEATP